MKAGNASADSIPVQTYATLAVVATFGASCRLDSAVLIIVSFWDVTDARRLNLWRC